MRLSSAAFLPVLLCSACTGSRRLPLTNFDSITRIEVRNRASAADAHVITATDRIARAVAAVRSVDSGWKQPTTTLPAGDVAALFYRDTVLVGVVWFGRNFLVARGPVGPLIRSATTEELVRLADAFEFPKKVIMVPPRGTT